MTTRLTLALICLGIVALRWRRAGIIPGVLVDPVERDYSWLDEPDDIDWLREFEQGPYLSIQLPVDPASIGRN